MTEILRQNASLLVFDGLLNTRDRAETELDVKTFVAEVQSQAAFVDCTVLFLTSTRDADSSPEHTMVDGVIDLCDDIAGARRIRRLQIMKSRGSRSIGGYHQYAIRSDGISIYPRLESRQGLQADDPVTTRCRAGVTGLDRLIGGGLPQGSVTLLMGPTGSGKTSLGLNFIAAASPEEPVLHFGFFETSKRLRLKAGALGIELPDQNGLTILWNPLVENLIDKLGQRLLDAVRTGGIKRLFLDGLGGFERAGAERTRFVEFFAALTNELRQLGVTTIATWEMRTLFGPALEAPSPEISALLDNLILLRQVEVRSRMLRAVAVLKMRDSDHDPRLHKFSIGRGGIEIVGPFEAADDAITGLARPEGR